MRWCQGAIVLSLVVLCARGSQGARAAEPEAALVDFHSDRRIDLRDFSAFARSWRGAEPAVDVAPPEGNGAIDFADLSVLAGWWLAEVPPPVTITWLGHASVRIACEDTVVYVDPQRLTDAPHDATWILVTHSHGDHYAPADIAKVKGAATRFAGPADVVQSYGSGTVLTPGQVLDVEGLRITGVASYNLTKTNHPKSRNWLGFIVELGARRVYVAGDTDLTPEMKALTDIDAAFLPAGGTYTMDAAEAAEATKYIKPTLAIPYHWGQVVGTRADAERFVKLAACNAKVMAIGETLSSTQWAQDLSFVVHWKLDETQGDVASDSAGDYDGGLVGGPVWQPSAGRVHGAILLDGIDDVIAAPFVLDPSGGAFSVFAWVKGGAPGQVILSQKTGLNWLMAAPASGALMTELTQAGRSGKALLCSTVITDGDWHRVGLVWDGSSRVLYVDNLEVVRDTQTGLQGSTTGLLLGAGSALTPGTFWSGLIDDVRIYTRAVKP